MKRVTPAFSPLRRSCNRGNEHAAANRGRSEFQRLSGPLARSASLTSCVLSPAEKRCDHRVTDEPYIDEISDRHDREMAAAPPRPRPLDACRILRAFGLGLRWVRLRARMERHLMALPVNPVDRRNSIMCQAHEEVAVAQRSDPRR